MELLAQLIEALHAQTQAINRLARSNEAIVDAMIGEGDLPEPSSVYLDGAAQSPHA